MHETPTALPDLTSEYLVTPEQATRYRQDGHILLRGVASPDEVAAYRAALADAVARYNTETRALEDRDTYGKAFLQVMNLWQKDEAIRRFVLARRFGKVAADLLGVDGVRLFHDQALFKEPGGGPTPWHQDQVYWPLDTDQTVTMWMPLVPVSAEVGSMTFVTGSHNQESRIVISDESEAYFDRMVAEQGLPRHTYGALAPGDATFHAGWTLHRAPGNPTDTVREVMTVIYFADGARILPPDTKARENDLKWFAGQHPGDLAASELNPLVYSR